MDDKNFKDLDQFFKTRLQKKETSTNGWDVPSDSILENALDQVNLSKESKKRKPFWLLLLLPIFIVFGYFLLQNNNEIDQLNTQITTLLTEKENESIITSEKDIKLLENKKETSPISSPRNNIDQISKTQSDNKEIKVVTKENSKSTNINSEILNIKSPNFSSNIKANDYGKKNNNINKQAAHIEQTINSAKDPVSSSKTSNNLSFITPIRYYKGSTQSLPSSSSKVILPLADLPFLDIIFLSHESEPTVILEDPRILNSGQGQSKKLSSFFTIGHLYSSLQMTNLPAVDYQLTDYDKFYGGWEIGTGLSYELNAKNIIGTKLTYSIVNNESHFSQNINYLKNQEYTNTDGNIFYDTDLEISSPTGDHIEPLTLDVTSANMQDGESLKNKTNLYQNFNIISLSGYGSHELFNFSDISFSIQAGIGLNLITSTSQKMEVSMMHNDHEMMSKSISNTKRYDLQKFYLNGQLGLQIQKPISKNWFIGFNSGINRSLTSIRKTTNSADPKTYIGSFQSSINLGFRF